MLEQYFLGKNKQGLDLLSLVDGDNSTDVTIKFKDIDITITQENLTLSEDNKYVYISLDYYNNEYKLTIEDIDGNLITKELEYYKTEPMLEIDGAKIEGNGKTGWGIKFNNTNNKYTLNSDGTIEEKEFDNWFIAWVSDGSKWSNTQYSKGDEITEEYTIIAKMYKTGEKVIFPDGTVAEEYHMKIEGNGPMAPLFNDKGELSSGVAWMDNVNFSNPQAWKWTSVTKLIIGEGITDISTGAFVYGVSLKEVTLPDTLNTIGRRSFWLMCVFDKYNNSRECNFDWKKSVL